MATREVFGRICQRVCQEQGWRLLPSGVEVRWRDGRHQVVSLEFFEFEDEELVRLYTTIGPVERLDPRRLLMALRINGTLAHGALAVRDDALVMIDTLPVEDGSAGEVEASIRYLAGTADRYEKTLFGTDEH